MKRITFITGYYGSGKTEIALNLAIQKHVDILVDLDIINPYFRSREQEEILKEHQILTISSDLEKGQYADLPYISKKVYMPFQMDDKKAIYDLGGNDLGAKLLRQFESVPREEVDLLLVINKFRIDTDSKQKVIQLIKDIEKASGWTVTGLIHNSNLLNDTTIEDILDGETLVKEVAEDTGLKVFFSCVDERINTQNVVFAGEKLTLKRYFKKRWY